jgi:hypothetical protein
VSDGARCPICGVGVVVDITDDVNREEGPIQRADSRELISYDCGHQVAGPSLAGADPDDLEVERRETSETVDPGP